MLEKGLAWLELDTFEMSHKIMNKNADMYTDDNNNNNNNNFVNGVDMDDDGGYFDGYHSEL